MISNIKSRSSRSKTTLTHIKWFAKFKKYAKNYSILQLILITISIGYGLKHMEGWNWWAFTHLMSITRFKAFDEKLYRWRFHTQSIYFKPNVYNFNIVLLTNFDFTDDDNRFYSNQPIFKVLLILTIKNCKSVNSNLIEQKRDLFSEFSLSLFDAYARWKGTGKPCPNFLWKLSKISLYRFEKFFVFWYGYMTPFHMVYEFWTVTPQLRL